MEESRESCIAGILARGLFRVRRWHQRTGLTDDPTSSGPVPTSNDNQRTREPEPPLTGCEGKFAIQWRQRLGWCWGMWKFCWR